MNRRTTRWLARSACAILVALLPGLRLEAACVPLAPEGLREAASDVVTGKVLALETRNEHSLIEGWGSIDTVVYCTIAVDTVEKGEGLKPGNQMLAQCFIARSRLCIVQWVGCSGHKPVPQPSQQVRAYVRREQASYQAVHPNGFAPLGEHPLLEPVEVQRAREALGGYTFLFPLELVALVVILSGLIAGVGAFIARSPQRRKQVKSLLAVPAVLSTVCLGGGVVRILSATHGWLPRLGFTAAGVIATAALGALSFWLLRGARRVPEAPAEAE